jgi:integrase
VVRNAVGETLKVNAHWFVDAIRQAKIPNFRWHDLRHTYASRLRQNGVPLGNIAELLGHKGLKMTNLAMSNLHEAVSRIQNPTDTTTDIGAADVFAYVQ